MRCVERSIETFAAAAGDPAASKPLRPAATAAKPKTRRMKPPLLIRHPQGATQPLNKSASRACFGVTAFRRSRTIFPERGFLATALELRKSQVRYSFVESFAEFFRPLQTCMTALAGRISALGQPGDRDG